MPQNVVDADTWTVTVETAADGDAVNGASRLLTAQDLADRSRYLYNRTIGPSGVGIWHVPLGDDLVNTAARWAFSQTSTIMGWEQTSVASAGRLRWPIVLPLTGRITQVEARVDGNLGSGGGTHAGLPGTMPRLGLDRQDHFGGTSAQVGVVSDPSASVAAYEVLHSITLSGLSEDIDEHKTWYVYVDGETGANALANELVLLDIRVTIGAAP
jgi:hypothetical protein